MSFEAVTINLIMLIPTVVIAIFVEKYYTAFWTGFWNLFALGVTGISLLISPPLHVPLYDSFWSFLPWGLVIVGFFMIVISFFFAPIARFVGSSHITASVLSATYLVQHFGNPNIFWITLVGTFIGIFAIKFFTP